MPKFPFMPFYWDRWRADTAHLTREEKGFYHDLLGLAWDQPKCDLPNDHEWIARKLGRIPEDEYQRVVEPLIREFFTLNRRRRLEQKGQRKVFNEVASKIAQKQRAAATRWKQKKSDDANAYAPHMQPKPKPKPKPNVEEYTPSNTENLESTERADTSIGKTLSYTDTHALNGADHPHPDIGSGDDTTPIKIGDEVRKAMDRARAASSALKKI